MCEDQLVDAIKELASAMRRTHMLTIGTPSTGGEIQIYIDPMWTREMVIAEIYRQFDYREFAIKKLKEQSTAYGFDKTRKE